VLLLAAGFVVGCQSAPSLPRSVTIESGQPDHVTLVRCKAA
jgi:hypothetical protein